MSGSQLSSILDFLHNRAQSIASLEDKAQAALHGHGDEKTYHQLMADRANLIAALDQDSRELTNELPDQLRDEIQDRLARFAHGARTALKINSSFYMSALLYNDEHPKDAPNNLQAFITELSDGELD